MVMKKQMKKANNKSEKVNIKAEKAPKKLEKEIPKEDDLSFDDMSDSELKKMLGNSDDSDLESDDFSEEVETTNKNSKKRKLESEDETENVKSKKCKVEKLDKKVEDETDEDDEDDEDEEFSDEEMSDDQDDEENDTMEVDVVPKKETKTKVSKPQENEAKKNIKQEENKNEDYKKIFDDTPKVESETLRNEIKDRIVKRKNKTLIITNLPFKFNYATAKELVPDMVSMILPYNLHLHKITGNVYIDINKAENVADYVKKLNDLEFQKRKLKAFTLSKVDDNIDNYNCNRLAVSNLSSKTNPEMIKKVLTKAINVVMMPLKSTDSRMNRVAFAEYKSVEDAISDIDSKHGAEINGLPINLKFQSKTNTNIKKTISTDFTSLKVLGINKTIKEADVKKLFPQAISINWKLGDQMATIKYESAEECKVDMTNAIKNKPNQHMKIYFKTLHENKKTTASEVKGKVFKKDKNQRGKEKGKFNKNKDDKKSKQNHDSKKFNKKGKEEKKSHDSKKFDKPVKEEKKSKIMKSKPKNMKKEEKFITNISDKRKTLKFSESVLNELKAQQRKKKDKNRGNKGHR